MGPGPLIAIDVVLLYTILGPLVLFGIYVLFDSLYGSVRKHPAGTVVVGGDTVGKKDPALWTNDDIDTNMNQI